MLLCVRAPLAPLHPVCAAQPLPAAVHGYKAAARHVIVQLAQLAHPIAHLTAAARGQPRAAADLGADNQVAQVQVAVHRVQVESLVTIAAWLTVLTRIQRALAAHALAAARVEQRLSWDAAKRYALRFLVSREQAAGAAARAFLFLVIANRELS